MKKILYITLVSLSVFCRGQVYPLNTSPGDIPSGSYIKDLDHELDKYEGLWKGEWSGKTLYIRFKKNKHFYSGSISKQFYMDRIVGERKIINGDGVVEIDRITNFDNEHPEFLGIGRSLKNYHWREILFYPKNMCDKGVDLTIINFDELNSTMTLRFKYKPSAYDKNCIHNDYIDQYDDFPINFPREDIVLTKVEE